MDFVSFLGGFALGAAGAALIDNAMGGKLLGQGVVSGPSSGGPFGGPGVMVGPPSSGGSFSGGGNLGPMVSVPPIVHDGDGEVSGDSFFGISASPWFFPLNVFPIYSLPILRPPQQIVCKKIDEEDGEETFVCEKKYQAKAVTWGPPSGWL